MHKNLLISLLGFTAGVLGAPASAYRAILLQNGEEAQALNRQFRGLKASDPCKNGQVACIDARTIAMCNGTSWNQVLRQCSGSQECFALPSVYVYSQGTRITCTSGKSAESLITASGATGGIFGNSTDCTTEVKTEDTTPSPSSGSLSATSAIKSSTLVYVPATTAELPTPSSEITTEVSSSSSAATTELSTPSSGTTPELPASSSGVSPAVTVTVTSYTTSLPPQTSIPIARVTVTVTLLRSRPTTLPPQTRTISPAEASSIIGSIEAAGGYTVSAANIPPSHTPTPIPPSPAANKSHTSSTSPLTSPPSSSMSPGDNGSY